MEEAAAHNGSAAGTGAGTGVGSGSPAAARPPATPEGMALAYGSLVLMALLPIFFGALRSVSCAKSKVPPRLRGRPDIPPATPPRTRRRRGVRVSPLPSRARQRGLSPASPGRPSGASRPRLPLPPPTPLCPIPQLRGHHPPPPPPPNTVPGKAERPSSRWRQGRSAAPGVFSSPLPHCPDQFKCCKTPDRPSNPCKRCRVWGRGAHMWLCSPTPQQAGPWGAVEPSCPHNLCCPCSLSCCSLHLVPGLR